MTRALTRGRESIPEKECNVADPPGLHGWGRPRPGDEGEWEELGATPTVESRPRDQQYAHGGAQK